MIYNQKIFKEQYPEIIKKYESGLSMKKLGKEYKVASVTIARILSKFNIKIRLPQEEAQKYEVDTNYFNKIDTEDKAYFLGLFYADGYVASNKAHSPYSGICLSGDDELEILSKFKLFCKFTGPILLKKKLKNKYKQPYTICIINKEFRNNLIKNGCVPNKSLVLKFPTFEIIPKNLFHHFLRGFWDGDGSITFYEKKSEISTSALTSVDFARGFINFIKKEINIKFGYYKRNKSIDLRISGKTNAIKFLLYIYKDANIFLKRKRNCFNNFINYFIKNSKNENFLKNKRKCALEILRNILNIEIMNVCKTELDKKQKEKIISLYNQKYSIYKISKILNINTGKITRYLKFNNLPTKRERLSKYTGIYSKILPNERKRFQEEKYNPDKILAQIE